MDSRDNGPSRRQVVGAAGLGLAAIAAAPAAAQTGSAPAGPAKISDPRTKYPKPPFKEQRQPFPGIRSTMDPVPDRGETSYKGSGRLAGRKALITDSGIGRAAAIAMAREGADVAINYLPAEVGIAPGPFWTPLQIAGGAQPDKQVKFGGQTPAGRPGMPAEIAGLFVRAAEDDGSYTTGNVLGAGGGQGQP